MGTVTLDGEDLLEMAVDERARAGIFLAMQYPAEVPGVTNSDFMRSSLKAKNNGEAVPLFEFISKYEATAKGIKNA